MATGTPATALLARQKVAHTLHPYEHDPRADGYGEEAATALGIEPHQIFKTLIATIDGRLVCAVVPVAGRLEQSDATAWMAGYCLAMGMIAAELAREEPAYDGMVMKFVEHFTLIARAINQQQEAQR